MLFIDTHLELKQAAASPASNVNMYYESQHYLGSFSYDFGWCL